MNYYCYIAGLHEPQLDNIKSVPALSDLNEELSRLLSSADIKVFNILRREYDNINFMSLLKDKEAEINPLGVLNKEDWVNIFNIIEEADELNPPSDKLLLPYYLTYYNHIKSQELQPQNDNILNEDFMASLYYDYAMKSNNKFIRRWFDFNLNVNNILSALICRKHGWNIGQSIVGNNVVANTIRKSTSSRDFNLKSEIDYFDTLSNISEMTNFIERERRINMLKWQWLDDNTMFEYFSLEKILAYYIRCQIIHRWDNLTVENGTIIFRQIIEDIKKKAVKF